MGIEIKELIIRAVVEQNSQQGTMNLNNDPGNQQKSDSRRYLESLMKNVLDQNER